MNVSAAVITVNGTTDTIAVDGTCTLREAITAANTNAVAGDCPAGTAGLDEIRFSIGGGGSHFIAHSTPLPDIVEPVYINGTTQPGFSGTPLIEVDGAFFASTPLFTLQPTAGGSTIRGLVLRNFDDAIVEIRSSGNLIAGNYFGTNGATTIADVLLGAGVMIVGTAGAPASNNIIGGATVADRNIFIASPGGGVFITAFGGGVADSNQILGNYFGWNAAKTATVGVFNDAISVGGSNTIIRNNAIGSAFQSGIAVGLATGTIVQSNEVGVQAAPVRFGIAVGTSTNSTIGAATSGGPGGNTITHIGAAIPDSAAVLVGGTGTGNRISGNTIMPYNTAAPGMGIDLYPVYGYNADDACDADTGANTLLNRPVLTSAVDTGATVLVDGSLNTAAGTYTIEFYGNPPNSGDQGVQYVGFTTVVVDGTCSGAFSTALAFDPPAPGWTITATNIDAANNTSEMSAAAPIVVLDAPDVSKQFTPSTVPAQTATHLTITLTNPNALAITGVAFTDNYPAGLTNALVPNVTNTCGGVITAAPAGSSLMLTGGVIPASGNCSVTVSVVPASEGSVVNTLPAGSVTSANAPPSDAAATGTLTVTAAPAPLPAEVPMSPQALLLLAIALSMAGALVLRR